MILRNWYEVENVVIFLWEIENGIWYEVISNVHFEIDIKVTKNQ